MWTARTIHFVVLLFAGLFALSLAAQDGSKDRIVGTAHDLSTTLHDSYPTCAFCHVPHNVDSGNQPAGPALWWNHEIPAGTVYRPYSSPSLQAAVSSLQAADWKSSEGFYSVSCLSCHDGQTAVNAVYSASPGTAGAPTTMWQLDPSLVIGTDLSEQHPVNFAYDAALVEADKGLWDVAKGTTVVSGAFPISSVRPTLTYDPYGAVQEPLLFNGTVQCATCHNPHSETNRPFLRVSSREDKLCYKCHSTSAAYNA